MNNEINYTVAIRTLGRAGDKYQQLLNSLSKQTICPSAINVYIAEGYPIPKETIQIERYIYVKKGMVAQRALSFDEIGTEYILFLDDDVYLPQDGVEKLFSALLSEKADVISPDVFPNAERSFWGRVLMTASGRMVARKDDGEWAYKVMNNAGYSYNLKPSKDVYLSQTNAGPCFLCKKRDMLSIHFEDELWLDNMPYAMGEDEVMFYKMYMNGLKILTLFNSGIIHLDAGSTLNSYEVEKTRIYCDFRFKTIFWHRFIYSPEKNSFKKFMSVISIVYTFLFSFLISFLKCRFSIIKIKIIAVQNARKFINSSQYRSLPSITDINI